MLWHKVNTEKPEWNYQSKKNIPKQGWALVHYYLTIIGTMTRKLPDKSIEKVKAFQEGLIVQIKFPCGHAPFTVTSDT